MIETEQTVTIAAPVGRVWDFACDIRRWAALMPGMQDCEIIDDDHSRWVLKVGVGGMVRIVRVEVAVDRWAGPGEVDFSYRLEGDPVSGAGTYRAGANGAGSTDVAFYVRVEGAGPLASMWEAMGRPLLPQLAKGFAAQFRDAVEAEAGNAASGAGQDEAAPRGSWLARLWRWLVRILGGGNRAH